MKVGDVIKYKFLFRDEETVGEAYAAIESMHPLKKSVTTEYGNTVLVSDIISVYKKE